MDLHVLYYAIWSKLDVIVAKLRPDDIIFHLLHKNVLTAADKRELDREGREKGDGKKIQVLVHKLLQLSQTQGGSSCLLMFMEALTEKKQDMMSQHIEREYDKLLSGPSEEFFMDLKRRNIEIWSSLTAIPSDKFSYVVSDYKMMMRPDFVAKLQQKGADRDKKPGSDPSLEVKYKLWNIGNLEEIFYNDPNDRDNVRTVLVKGDSGSGKSAMLQKYVCKWAMARQNAADLHANTADIGPEANNTRGAAILSYKLVFYLPLKHVIRCKDLMDMLCGPVLKYFRPPDRFLLERYFSDPENEARTLFILDGLDDVNIPPKSDLIRLIQGEIYPLSKVVLCGRLYAVDTLTQFNFYPDAIINIKGIVTESGARFLSNTLSDMSEANIKHITQLYLNSTCDSHLLQTPLHLAMAAFLFYHHRQDGVPMDEFMLPVTMTQLFNAFMLRLMKLYLKKCGKKENCFFIRNALSQDAAIPADLKHLIYVLGRLSFLSLVNEQYVYTEDDLQANLVGNSLTEQLGVCSPVLPAQSNAFFFRNKLMAEYLAGIYLSMEGFRVPEFATVFENLQKEPLQKLLGRLQNTVRFACGVSTNFFREILKIATRKCVLLGNPAKDCYMAAYDATLYFETQDISTAFSFAWYLQHTELRSKFTKVDTDPTVYEWTAALFVIDNLEYATICKLFGRFYDMHLKPLEKDPDEAINTELTYQRLQAKYEIAHVEKTRKGQLKKSSSFHFHQSGLFMAAASSILTFHNLNKVSIKDEDSAHISTFLTLGETLEAFPNAQYVQMKNMALHSHTHRIIGDKNYSALLQATKDTTGVEELSMSPHLVSVIDLDNVNPPHSVIADLRRLEHIENVQFQDCRISEQEFESLSTSLRGSRDLKTLAINDNPLATKAMNLFSILATKPEFEELSMASCSLNDGAEILQAAMTDKKMGRLQQLQVLDVSHNNLNHRSFAVLEFFAASQLKVLKLEGNPLGPIAVKLFHHLAQRDHLRELYMNNCALDGAIQPLQTELRSETIHRMHNMDVLHVCSNWLHYGSDALLRYFSTSQITSLRISDNPLGDALISLLYVVVETDTLEELYLDNCDLDESVESLEVAVNDEDMPLKPLHRLTELSLCNNGLRETSLPLLQYFTDANSRLKILRLSKNPIGSSLVPILNSLAKHNTLRELHLENCNLEAALKPLSEAMETDSVGKLRRLRLIDISHNFLEYITKGTPNRTLENYFSASKHLTYVCKN